MRISDWSSDVCSSDLEDLLAAHLVRDHQHELVALLLRDQGQADAGVARRALDQGVAGLDVAALLGGLDHAHADAVLDRTPGFWFSSFRYSSQAPASRSRALTMGVSPMS